MTLDLYANNILKEHVFYKFEKVINRHACVLKKQACIFYGIVTVYRIKYTDTIIRTESKILKGAILVFSA